MKTSNYLANLPQEVTIDKITAYSDYDHLSILVPNPKERLCPHCGSVDCIIKDSGTRQTVRHIAINNRGTVLTFHKRRMFCKGCRSTYYENPYWTHSTLHMTWVLYDAILKDLMESISITEIARRNCVTDSIVRSVLDSIKFGLPKKLPETLCIDEFKGNSGLWSSQRKKWYTSKFHCNISDGDSHAVIDILDQISSPYLHKYFLKFPPEERKSVKYFCCDMSNSFVSLAKKDFPNAKVCIDPFHVIQRLDDMVDEVRCRIQREFKDAGDTDNYKKVKHLIRLLKTKQLNQIEKWGTHTNENVQRLNDAFAVAPDLQEAYDALQHFHDIMDSFPFTMQTECLTEWLKIYTYSEVGEVRSAACTIKHWRGYIQNSWKYKKSNAISEGFNNKVKVLKRISFGLHNFETFRKRILLTCGKIKLTHDPSTIFDVAKAGREIRL
jgi:transposase